MARVDRVNAALQTHTLPVNYVAPLTLKLFVHEKKACQPGEVRCRCTLVCAR
ncbi:MAG: hypothetical protein MUP74_04460 [Desulfobacterales bacterium]|nr:hypothetical protein [Desulfobacterales bacterium]